MLPREDNKIDQMAHLCEKQVFSQPDDRLNEIKTMASRNLPGRKRTRKSKIQQVLDDLPHGVRFIGRDDQYTEEYFTTKGGQSIQPEGSNASLNGSTDGSDRVASNEGSGDGSELIIGLFAIQLDQITLMSLKRMRYVLPRDDYRRLKDRISARNIRRKRTEKTNRLLRINALLK